MAILEDETKNVLKAQYFADYDWTRVIGKIDLVVRSKPQLGSTPTNYLWAETKQGKKKDIYGSFIQLILTIGRARIYEHEVPPYFLGAADAEKIAFVEYNKVMHIFSKNDFNWNVTPSDYSTKEFKELYSLLHDELASDVRVFKYAFDDKLLRKFIKQNFKEGRKDAKKQSVGKNNFTFVYFDWVKSVKDSIAVDWQALQKAGILDCDFFLADLMSKDGMSIKDKLKVVLEKTKYKVLVKADLGGFFGDAFKEFTFKDGQVAYNQFWNRYERPPKPIYQRYILDRRDLLVPQDIREIKGSYYTPERWVRLSQEYLAKTLGEDWQEEYYVWDCAAGSGNLLRGLTNKYNIYASTLDDSDVKVMHDAIDGGRLNLVKSNVFQFDFLNDGYEKAADGSIVSALAKCEKLPESLRDIIADPYKRKKLVIYINPPYGEAGSRTTVSGTGSNKTDIAVNHRTYELYSSSIGIAGRELYAQFFARIVTEIPSCYLSAFSKLKMLTGPNFSEFRGIFHFRFKDGFIVPAETFDNISGNFPIGFLIWDTSVIEEFDSISCYVYDAKGNPDGSKVVSCYKGMKTINDWIITTRNRPGEKVIGFMSAKGCDFQNINYNYIINRKDQLPHPRGTLVTDKNLMEICVYYAVMHCVSSSWLNDRDLFLYPDPVYGGDVSFVTNCFVYTLFNNRISSLEGVNHWIPFYEDEVDSPASFNSRFMADYLHGRVPRTPVAVVGDIFDQQAVEEAAKVVPFDVLTPEALAVLDVGREIWRYYLEQPGVNVNASFLDIRAYFQGYKTTDKGKRIMNSSSSDDEYMRLWNLLKTAMKDLEARIEPKIYEYGFLLK